MHQLDELADPVILANVVKAGAITKSHLDLESALVLLPNLRPLLCSPCDEHVLAAMEAAAHIVHTFGKLIRSTRALAKDMLGVDLSAETRQQRCQACYEQLQMMMPEIEKLAKGRLKVRATVLLESINVELSLS